MTDQNTFRIAVFGAASCNQQIYEKARTVGKEIAAHNAVLINGGLGGVMEGAARGAFENNGLTIGILPAHDDSTANPYISIPIVTNLGHGRNIVLAHTCHGAIAIAGEFGTLSEIAITLKLGKPVIALDSWNVDPRIETAASPEEAVCKLLNKLEKKV